MKWKGNSMVVKVKFIGIVSVIMGLYAVLLSGVVICQ